MADSRFATALVCLSCDVALLITLPLSLSSLSVEEAIEVGKRAIYHATHRDAYSGGVINGLTTRSGKMECGDRKWLMWASAPSA